MLHVLRGLGLQLKRGIELSMPVLDRQIGQNVFAAPSIFGFYNYDYSPEGVIADMVWPLGHRYVCSSECCRRCSHPLCIRALLHQSPARTLGCVWLYDVMIFFS